MPDQPSGSAASIPYEDADITAEEAIEAVKAVRAETAAARREWGVTVFRNAKGAPMLSLGFHVDLHTPTLDLHLPLATVQIGRNQWDGRRFVYNKPEPWSGHSDNCDRLCKGVINV